MYKFQAQITIYLINKCLLIRYIVNKLKQNFFFRFSHIIDIYALQNKIFLN